MSEISFLMFSRKSERRKFGHTAVKFTQPTHSWHSRLTALIHFSWVDQRERELRGKQRESGSSGGSRCDCRLIAVLRWQRNQQTQPGRLHCPGKNAHDLGDRGRRYPQPLRPDPPPLSKACVCVCVCTVYVLSLISFLCHLAPQASVDLPVTWILMFTCSRNTYLYLAAVLSLGYRTLSFYLHFFLFGLMSIHS